MNPRKDGEGTCEHCAVTFDYYLIHNGFNASAYAYCSDCGLTALLNGSRMPKNLNIPLHQRISSSSESKLRPCPCGGRFVVNAVPRCPACHKQLSAIAAATWIEAQAAGTSKGWRWRRGWDGLYAIIINDRLIDDNWAVS